MIPSTLYQMALEATEASRGLCRTGGMTKLLRTTARPVPVTRFTIVLLASAILPPVASADSDRSESELDIPAIHVNHPRTAPPWALMQRHLIESMDRAGVAFYDTYVKPDGTLRWKERYEGGMNSSDDAYEGFRGFSLHHVLGGAKRLDTLHRHVWEGITRQFSRYGQIYREFDSNWDWMHHGEGYVSFYPLGMADPFDERFRERSVRFAAIYIGEDPEAPNYNPDLNLMRASMNGSRGPKMQWTKRDWIPTNANLVYYHLPFDDIPGVPSSTGWINDQPADDQFGRIVKTMSDRMARGDVPINLTAAPLIANAFLYSAEDKYRRWVVDYLTKWMELTEQNEGITPDNVGISGKIGEHTGGRWWGGYYGWKWPRGGTDVVLASLTAAKVAVLLTGESRWLELPRSQMGVLRERSETREGVSMVPIRYDDRNQWHHFVPEPAHPYVHLWHTSQKPEDWANIERLAALALDSGRLGDPDLGWGVLCARPKSELPRRGPPIGPSVRTAEAQARAQRARRPGDLVRRTLAQPGADADRQSRAPDHRRTAGTQARRDAALLLALLRSRRRQAWPAPRGGCVGDIHLT